MQNSFWPLCRSNPQLQETFVLPKEGQTVQWFTYLFSLELYTVYQDMNLVQTFLSNSYIKKDINTVRMDTWRFLPLSITNIRQNKRGCFSFDYNFPIIVQPLVHALPVNYTGRQITFAIIVNNEYMLEAYRMYFWTTLPHQGCGTTATAT